MSIVLNKDGLTQKQIDAIDPLILSANSYDRKIKAKQQELGLNPAMEYQQEQRVRSTIASLEEKRRDIVEQIHRIMNAKNVYDKKISKCQELLKEAAELKDLWEF